MGFSEFNYTHQYIKMKSYGVTIQMKPLKQFFYMVLIQFDLNSS